MQGIALKPRPDAAALHRQMETWLTRQKAADERGNALEARNCGAQVERARRWPARLKDLAEGTTYPYHFSVHRMGDEELL